MSETIRGSGGRLRAPIAREPRGVQRSSGYMRPTSPSRVQPSALADVPACAGDFGPLLYWHADDATPSAWPCRSSVEATLKPYVGEMQPSIETSSVAFGGVKVVRFADGDTTCLQSPDLSSLFSAAGMDNHEIVIVCAFTDTAPAAQRRIFGTTADESSPSNGTITNSLTPTGNAVHVRNLASPDARRSLVLPQNEIVILSFVTRKSGANGVADLYVQGVGSDYTVLGSTAAPSWTASRVWIGADTAGYMLSAGMEIREIAVYDRVLTRTERSQIWRGYVADRAIKLSDLISGVRREFDASDSTIRTVGGAFAYLDGGDWYADTGTAAPTWVGSDPERRVLSCVSVPATVADDRSTAVASGTAWEVCAAWGYPDTATRIAVALNGAYTDDIASTAAGDIRARYNGTSATAAASLSSPCVAFGGMGHDGTSGLDVYGAALASYDNPAIVAATGTAAVAARAGFSLSPRLLQGLASGALFLGALFVTGRVLTVEERRTALRFFQAERQSYT